MNPKDTVDFKGTGNDEGRQSSSKAGETQYRGPSTPRRSVGRDGAGGLIRVLRPGKPSIFLTALALALAVSLALFTDLAQAARLRAKVYIVQAKVPRKLTERGLIRFARSRNTRRLRETKEPKLKDRSWKANLVIAFNQPPGDLEFQVLFYDIHDGPRRLVEDLSTFVNDRSQKTYLQKIKLERPRFKPNRNMELVVVVRRREVARMKFGVLGQEYRRSGTVTFSDDEAKL
jgi:hypothetical protein